MSDNVLDELMALAEFDPEEIKYIRQNVAPETMEKYDDEQLQYIIDLLLEYLEQHEDDEDEDIIVDDVAQYVVAQAKKENMGDFDLDEVSDILNADFDYLETQD